jgi:hypothetical protein
MICLEYVLMIRLLRDAKLVQFQFSEKPGWIFRKSTESGKVDREGSPGIPPRNRMRRLICNYLQRGVTLHIASDKEDQPFFHLKKTIK